MNTGSAVGAADIDGGIGWVVGAGEKVSGICWMDRNSASQSKSEGGADDNSQTPLRRKSYSSLMRVYTPGYASVLGGEKEG